MDKKSELSLELYCSQTKIRFYEQMTTFSMCSYQRNYCLHLLQKEIEESEKIMKNIEKISISEHRDLETQREFTVEELAKYNGEGEMPAYVAVEGIVYDVSMHIGWAGGTHFGLYAGKDLTNQFSDCHLSILKILSDLPKVGILKK